jgi:hypothetical protein
VDPEDPEQKGKDMIFTRHFGALAARPTFPSTEPAIDVKDYEARVAADRESDVAPAQQVHHLHLHLPRRKRSEDKQHAA